MLHHEQTGCRGHAAAVLDASAHLCGEGCRTHFPALGAPFLFGLMLNHHMALARELNDLTGLDHVRLDRREFRLAVVASRNAMTHDLIWLATSLDGFSR